MAFVKCEKPKIGDWVTTKYVHENRYGYMEIGTEVEVTGITERGYDIKDAAGNAIPGIGWGI